MKFSQGCSIIDCDIYLLRNMEEKSMKKTWILALAAVLVLGAAGCGKKSDTPASTALPTASASSGQTEGGSSAPAQPSGSPANGSVSDGDADSTAQAPSSDAPVVESAEELESMVDEFNNTDDPERKEELRKQLEQILASAEAQAGTAE